MMHDFKLAIIYFGFSLFVFKLLHELGIERFFNDADQYCVYILCMGQFVMAFKNVLKQNETDKSEKYAYKNPIDKFCFEATAL